ncbi:pirin family protein [Sinomicrobium weinanense]|uniref:Pirin family protein n=1 Tax=Sinomicrobium weinanense TaxID=2842200 RepID=A0A926JQU6_9FLAO|nr:pirin family protein [Sinomicrobium weinanense]MBC9795679.1 pirin family protein [Sinomicrobium weinanense]MBU3122848.1 pirin family protein [Sinomicrobium weinanense]
MSNTDLIIAERSRDIGDFLVGRLIPFRKKRMVGPFIFIDHMGPEKLGPDKYMDVDQHPHIGLATLTYLLEGEIMHKDSIGTEQRINPGSVNLMVAGKGVTHTERTPADLRNGHEFTVHGYQIWIALPKELEDMAPEFYHISRKDLPSWTEDGAEFTLVAGKGFGKVSPVPTHSDLFMVSVEAGESFNLDIAGNLKGEIGICIVEGKVNACGQEVGGGNMLVSKLDNQCALQVEKGTHLLLFGGAPFEEERYIYWNFVSSDKEKIEKAKENWREKRFPKVQEDDTYVPLP